MSAPTLRAYPQRLRRWIAEPVNGGVVRAAGTVALLTVAGNVAALLRDAVVARRFGLGDQLDAYLTALLVPTVAITIISGSLTVALLPVFVRVRDAEGLEAAHALVSRVTGWAALALAVAALVLGVLAPLYVPVLGPAFPPAKLTLVRHLLLILLPSLLLSGLTAIWTAVLNAGERFALAAAAPSAVPLATIAALLAFPGAGAHALAAGTTTGFALAAALVGVSLRRTGLSPLPTLAGMTPAMRAVFQEYWPMVIGALFMSGTNLVDQAMAAGLEAGSVAALGLGGKLTTAAVGVASVALGAAVFPALSRWAAAGDWRALARGYRHFSGLGLAAGMAGALALALAARPLVELFFAGRAFGEAEVERVVLVQRCIAWQLPFAAAGLIGARMLSALGRNRALMTIAGINLLVNAVGNLALIPILGVPGIALATSVTYLISFAAIAVVVRRELARCDAGVAEPSSPSRP